MGRVLEIGQTHILAEIDRGHHTLDAEDRQSIELAYVSSVHKAKGSQWRKVTIPIFDSRIVERSQIYTALTRAQDQVKFVDWIDLARQR